MGDVGGIHSARTKVKSELHGNQNDRKQNADERHREANAIVQQVTKC
jgi:hypothetical protein